MLLFGLLCLNYKGWATTSATADVHRNMVCPYRAEASFISACCSRRSEALWLASLLAGVERDMMTTRPKRCIQGRDVLFSSKRGVQSIAKTSVRFSRHKRGRRDACPTFYCPRLSITSTNTPLGDFQKSR